MPAHRCGRGRRVHLTRHTSLVRAQPGAAGPGLQAEGQLDRARAAIVRPRRTTEHLPSQWHSSLPRPSSIDIVRCGVYIARSATSSSTTAKTVQARPRPVLRSTAAEERATRMSPAPDRNLLSLTQRKILEFIQITLERKGHSPSIREIGEAVEVSSSGWIRYQLGVLVREGHLYTIPNSPRSLSITSPGSISPPGKSTVPTESDDSGPPRLLQGCTDAFVLRITGDSLRTAPHGRITSGDILLFKQQTTAEPCDTIAFRGEDGHVSLARIASAPEGRHTPSLAPSGTQSVLGVVKHIFGGIRDSSAPTTTRAAVLEFIETATQANGRPPLQTEISKAIGITKSTVSYHIRDLEQSGHVRRYSDRQRNVVLAAGARGPERQAQDISKSPRRLRACPDIFLQRITGEPLLNGPHGMITERDVLVIRRQHTAAEGDLAAVLSEGHAVLTRVRESDDSRRFLDTNPGPRMDDAVLLGVVVGVTTDC